MIHTAKVHRLKGIFRSWHQLQSIAQEMRIGTGSKKLQSADTALVPLRIQAVCRLSGQLTRLIPVKSCFPDLFRIRCIIHLLQDTQLMKCCLFQTAFPVFAQ